MPLNLLKFVIDFKQKIQKNSGNSHLFFETHIKSYEHVWDMPKLYISENLGVFLVTFPIVLIFAIFSIIAGRSYLKTKNRATLFLVGFNLSMMLTYTPWTIRGAFYPGVSASATIILLWRIAYMFGTFAIVFAMMFSLILIYAETIKRLHYLGMLFLILFIIFSVAIADINETMYCDVTDFQPSLPFQVLFMIIILSTLIIPNFIFLKYLNQAERGTIAYRKVLFLELGLAACTFGLLADGAKLFDNNWALFIFRALIAVGGFLMLVGVKISPKRQSKT